MKRYLAALFAAGALAVAVPSAASAQERGYYGGGQYGGDQYGGGQYGRGQYGRGGGWNRDSGSYNNLRSQFQHAYDGIQHGVRDGSFSRGEARQFYWAIGDLRYRLGFYRNNDGYLDRREARDLDRRLARLHAHMHDAHEAGHQEQDYGYGGRYGDDLGGHDHDRD